MQAEREALAQLFFEQFGASGLYCIEQPIAALASAGRTSGLVIDLGHSKTGKSLLG